MAATLPPDPTVTAPKFLLVLALGVAAAFANAADNNKRSVTPSGLDAIFERADAAAARGAVDEAFGLLAEAAERWPARAGDSLSYPFIVQRLAQTRPGDPGRHRLLQALHAAGYRRAHGLDTSPLWRELALDHLQRDEVEAARLVLERVEDPYVWLGIRSDRRFDRAVSGSDPRNALDRFASRRVAELRSRVLQAPEVSEAVFEQLLAMMMTGQYEEILILVDEVEARLAEGFAFSDADDGLSWIHDTGARAELRLGRFDQAVARYRRAAQTPESGVANVSQRINLAQMLTSLGRGDEAAVEAEAVGEAISPYGRMVLATVRWRIARLQGKPDAEAAAAAYLQAHRADGQEVYGSWLIDAGRLDEAAAALIARLEDPSQRQQALLSLQVYPTAERTPADAAYARHLDAVRARADVQAAIDRVGRVLDVPIHSPW